MGHSQGQKQKPTHQHILIKETIFLKMAKGGSGNEEIGERGTGWWGRSFYEESGVRMGGREGQCRWVHGCMCSARVQGKSSMLYFKGGI